MNNGTLLNNTYRILYPIGMGGLGEIYLGYHENLQKYVVIKKVKDHCTGLLNNRIEVDILKGLHHTYLPQVYDFIQINDGIFTVMDYISGHDLKYYIDAGYRFEEAQLVLWMKQLCQVLDYLHSRKPAIIHCDIKPGNIMITEEGNICLIDFNISLDGENNKELVGLSSSFASPEQVRKAEYVTLYGSGDAVKMDERTDIYSVGAVFYYVMSGNRPNVRKGYTIPLKKMEHMYSDSLANIVDKAMEENPARRFRSAAKMLDALEHQEKWQSRYLKLWKTGILLDMIAGCLTLVLMCFIILGYRGMQNEKFFASYDTYMEQVNAWVEETDRNSSSESTEGNAEAKQIAAEGIRLLNENTYKKVLEKYPAQRAAILYSIGQAYFYMDDYEQVCDYLEEAVELEQSSPEMYRDLAIAQANLGNIRRAKKNLEKSIETGLNQNEGILLMAEISLAEEDYESVWEYALQVMESSNTNVAERASYYILESGKVLEKTTECIELLERLENQSDGAVKAVWLRKRAELCYQRYSAGDKEFLEKATLCYEKLYESGYAQLADFYNLVSCYSEQGQLQKAKELLMTMQEDYPGEYKVYMRLAYLCYKQQNDIPAKSRNYEKVLQYFEKAREICDEKKIDWKADANMVQIQEIIRQLEEQGWL